MRKDWDDRDKVYFRHGILAAVRAIDFLFTLKEFNGKELGVTGISQGGGLALIVAGLDPRVTAVAANIPGLCDLNGRLKDRIDGWPHVIGAVPEDVRAKIAATTGYYDAVNFAPKVKGKSLVGVGFLDVACPPTTGYAAFNRLPEPKKMIDSPRLGHATDPRWLKARNCGVRR